MSGSSSKSGFRNDPSNFYVRLIGIGLLIIIVGFIVFMLFFSVPTARSGMIQGLILSFQLGSIIASVFCSVMFFVSLRYDEETLDSFKLAEAQKTNRNWLIGLVISVILLIICFFSLLAQAIF